MTEEKAGLLRRAVRALAAGDEELDAQELRREAESVGAQPMSRCGEREIATILGTVRSLTIRPRSGAPSLEVEMYDGTATVTLIWLGRREIAGIGPGRQLRATGCVTTMGDRRVIYNPRYELVVRD
jgi:hypothetical protein